MYRGQTEYQRQDVADHYDARRFTSWKGRLVDRMEKALVVRALSGLPPGARILDLPTGTGRMSALLRERGFRLVAADISLPMLLHARRKLPETPLLAADAGRLPFPDGAFDAVLAVRLMHHVPAALRATMLAEFARVSRELVVATFADSRSVAALVRRLRHALSSRRMPIYAASHAEIVAEASQAGLRLRAHWPMLPLYASTHVYVFQPAGPGRSPDRRPDDSEEVARA